MERILIVAIGENGEIGNKGKLPWPKLSVDLRRFKSLTLEHTVVMGRKTFDSILNALGRPLDQRVNIVLSKNQTVSNEPDLIWANSLETALQRAETEKVFLIGGASIYQEALERGLVDKLFITRVHASFEADTFFPEVDWERWEQIEKQREIDEGTSLTLTFEVYTPR
jgi:dihydrofolate reductase